MRRSRPRVLPLLQCWNTTFRWVCLCKAC
jgi:hypothetical protein